jgi:hypothetical protein
MPVLENSYRRQRFTEFLDALVTEKRYARLLEVLREPPKDRSHARMYWHGVEELLHQYPEALDALRGFAFERWDPEISFSPCNLKAQYILDEDFADDGGRAFILFNLVATNWTYVGTVGDQLFYWDKIK